MKSKTPNVRPTQLSQGGNQRHPSYATVSVAFNADIQDTANAPVWLAESFLFCTHPPLQVHTHISYLPCLCNRTSNRNTLRSKDLGFMVSEGSAGSDGDSTVEQREQSTSLWAGRQRRKTHLWLPHLFSLSQVSNNIYSLYYFQKVIRSNIRVLCAQSIYNIQENSQLLWLVPYPPPLTILENCAQKWGRSFKDQFVLTKRRQLDCRFDTTSHSPLLCL